MNGKRFSPDDPERRRWQDPDVILTTIGLEPGMVFVDIGCNEGYFALPAARIAGSGGKVFGVDISPEAIGHLASRARDEGLTNMVLRVGTAEDAVVCRKCADFVFYGIDLHDFRDPAMAIRNAGKMLKPSGLLVDLDWKDEPTPFGPPAEIRFSIEKATSLIRSIGFHILSVAEAGPYHYLIIAGLR
ncbi:MAG TPA: methyltransferase domain-containing protein [Methanoregulaceae archaeon]|nr:methyltransferase domain-containing protein [Methanoregulaceae archaeon]